MIIYEDKIHHFSELFDENSGLLIRSNVFGTKNDPYMRSFPELIDIGIKGSCKCGQYGFCKKAGVDCYQQGNIKHAPDMSVEDFERLLKECSGKTFQVALGGAGDPNTHDSFEELLEIAHFYHIVPNLTTSGFDMTDGEVEAIKQYCGAVAVSFYSLLMKDSTESNKFTLEAIQRLIKVGCETNIHYVISSKSIDEAIMRLKHDLFPKGINAVVFLLYKPVGNGVKEKMLERSDERLSEFLDLALGKNHPYKIGFDTCFASAIIDRNDIDLCSIDSCEAARFSMYIDSILNAYPCSFDCQNGLYKVLIKNKSIQYAWNSPTFQNFRNHAKLKCHNCEKKEKCCGDCALDLGLKLCNY